MLLKRFLYLGYYFKKMNWKKYNLFLNHVNKVYGVSKPVLFLNSVGNSLKYNISPLEYFLFHFFEKNSVEKAKWAGTGFMYEYQKLMNPLSTRETLLNKAKFLKHNAAFITHKWLEIENGDFDRLREFVESVQGKKIVLKNIAGNCGIGVQVIDTKNTSVDNIIALAKQHNLTLVEEFIYQHDELSRLSPSALNTVHIFTQIVNDKVVILGTRLRISVNSNVDNLAAGNMAAAVDEKTGVIVRPAIYSDITKEPESVHPITGVNIVGFHIPNWDLVLQKVKEIALHNKENRSVGWDIAVTNDGVDFIEGNHDWCKLVYQLPVGKGLKDELMKYL